MNLPEWCQTHSFKDFLELLNQPKGNTMNEEITNPGTEATATSPAAQLTDAELEAILAGKPAFVTEGDETADEATVH